VGSSPPGGIVEGGAPPPLDRAPMAGGITWPIGTSLDALATLVAAANGSDAEADSAPLGPDPPLTLWTAGGASAAGAKLPASVAAGGAEALSPGGGPLAESAFGGGAAAGPPAAVAALETATAAAALNACAPMSSKAPPGCIPNLADAPLFEMATAAGPPSTPAGLGT